MVKKFCKKPIVVEAMEYKYPASQEMREWMGKVAGTERCARHIGAIGELHVYTLEDGAKGQAKHIASSGDWIIKGIAGEFYPCKPNIFQSTYEAIEGSETEPSKAQEREGLLVGNFDAVVWAKEFVEAVKSKPSIATDKDAMTGWFANAIMAGFDRGKKETS